MTKAEQNDLIKVMICAVISLRHQVQYTRSLADNPLLSWN